MKEKIKAYRESKNWTQSEMAGKLGITQAALSLIEAGERSISKNVALKLTALNKRRFPLSKLLTM